MKHYLLAPALILSAASFAQAEVSFYGRANISYQNTSREIGSNSDQWELNSNASRIGVKGSIPVDDTNITAIFQAEYEVAFDDGESATDQTFKQRNTFAGLTGSWGTIIAGQVDTDTKNIRREVDLFNDLALGDIKNFISGENRVKNTIRYSTPSLLNHLSGSIAVVPGENSSTDQDGPADGSTLSLRYDGDNFVVAYAHDDEINGKNIDRAIAHVDFMSIGIGLLIQTAEISRPVANNEEEEEAGLLSLKYHATDKLDLKVQTGHTEIDLFNSEKELDQIAIGIDYRISKSLMAYGYSAQITSKTDTNSTLKDQTTGIGMELRF
ncbi:porin [Zhongshania sp. BJYM1]|uniref:porin n=1 Tax=Zhongshania aquatica TaxID=2965069 RepID=UPI0022B411FB|nr:porin [Marortus sp. BJYM1]